MNQPFRYEVRLSAAPANAAAPAWAPQAVPQPAAAIAEPAPAPAADPAPTPLFRAEVIDTRRERLLGAPRIVAPLALRAAAPFAAAAVAAIAGLLVLGSYSRRTTVNGVMTPVDGIAKINAPAAGRIVQLAASEGQVVTRGQLLYTLDIDALSNLGGTQVAVVEELRRQRQEHEAERLRKAALDRAQKQELVQREHDTAREIGQIDQQIAVSGEYVKALKEGFARYQEYARRQIVVQMQVDIKEQAYMAERQQLERLRRERLQLATKLSELRSQIATSDTRSASAQSELTRQIAQTDQAIAEGESKRALWITAPRDGIVTGIVARAGETVAAGAPMATILPGTSRLLAELGAPSSAIGFIEPGQKVLLRYEAFPYQKFGQYGGRVKAISRIALRPEELADLRQPGPSAAPGPAPGNQNLYRITVEPERAEVNAYGAAQKVTAGMRVQATVFLDKRPLYQWILDPLYSLSAGTAGAGSP
ncbi:HlyD family secretion protein [Chelatococcus reniformis]|uniref:Secretion protein n=1 Tax=Chelatococcus reniformis TaxID=1494448 RepID=A0A916UX37_9HYPH|nr:HlyD family efflux transporter periplasmic adaptor subunit [Chelatococcus reniformis]GGC92657.1 secretion protein [Chelatococcus reniformis]